ncbi:uncharacterized, partial [Tachysurus ichikawai]
MTRGGVREHFHCRRCQSDSPSPCAQAKRGG